MNTLIINRNFVLKEIARVICLASMMFFLGCDKIDDLEWGNNLRKKYLVDKITCFETSSNYRSAEYYYDNGSKPNFGIDYLIVYDPFIGMGGETGFARELSLNNLTKQVNSGTT